MLLTLCCSQSAKAQKENRPLRTVLSGKGAGTPVRSARLM